MTKSILYIEDDPASRALVERTLRFGGYNVAVAACGIEGIDMARHETFDLILTDINLPDMNGREITTALRRDQRFAHTPIVALTGVTVAELKSTVSVPDLLVVPPSDATSAEV